MLNHDCGRVHDFSASFNYLRVFAQEDFLQVLGQTTRELQGLVSVKGPTKYPRRDTAY